MQRALPSITRRSLLRGAGAAAVVALAGCGTPAQAPARPRLRLLAEKMLPHSMDFRGTTVGGLSALDFDPLTGLWAALSDDRSERQPARFYTLAIEVLPERLDVQVRDVVTLRQADGRPYPPRNTAGEVVDPEGLRLLPGGRGALWTSEGDRRLGQPPALHEVRLDGSFVRTFELPAHLHFSPEPGVGPRNNLTLEGLALTPDARTAWAAMEAALQQDGPVPTVAAAGGPCRLTAFDVASGRPLRQLAYLPDAIPHAPLVPGGLAENGISEVLMVDADRMLVLERAFALGAGTSMRIYEIDTRAASDTLQLDRLVPGAFRPAPKRLVADFSQLGLSRLDNTEGMCWGPTLANGHRSLVVVSDDNFNPLQVTQFAAFDYPD